MGAASGDDEVPVLSTELYETDFDGFVKVREKREEHKFEGVMMRAGGALNISLFCQSLRGSTVSHAAPEMRCESRLARRPPALV